jgi:5-hydroxyisourate hydrolase-like protein (transthyretin family)
MLYSLPSRAARTAAAALALVLTLGTASMVAAQTAGAVPTSVDLCDQQVAPGHATCFAIKNTAPRPMSAGGPAGYGPAELQSAYALPSSTGGLGQTVYIVDAYDDPTAESDLAVYRSQFGLPACTTANGCFGKMNQNGTSRPMPAVNSGWRGEISLDLDMVSAVCPNCSIRLVEANDSGSGLYTAVRTAVAKGAKFVSMSWGGPEWSGETAQDSVFATPGVLFAASSGDNGFAAGVSYPSASPNVLSVGGTRLTTAANARGWTESAWTGAGSGCTLYEAKPSLQSFNPDSLCAHRADTDVSAVADPATGVAVYNAGGWGVFGGTSASAPIVTSIYALAGPPPAGDLPATYPYTNVNALNDVTSGSNGSCGGSVLCTSAVGWDGPTGLGTPNGIAAFNGTGSSTPVITVLGANVSADPEVPGLPSDVSVTPIVPTGHTLTSVSWKASRTDCVFADPTAQQTTVTCNASATGTAKITVTLTDSAGLKKAVTATLRFNTTGGKRTLGLAMTVDGQSGAADVCTANPAAVVASVVDTATGTPVKGIAVSYTRFDSNRTKAAGVGTSTTAASGSATRSISTTVATSYTVQARATGIYLGTSTLSAAVTPAKCTTTLQASSSTLQAWYGLPVTVTGTLTRPDADNGSPRGVNAMPVSVLVTPAPRVSSTGKVTVLKPVLVTRVLTAADGSFKAAFKAGVAGELTVQTAATSGLTASTVDLGAMTVSLPTTSLTAQPSLDELMYSTKLTVTGSLMNTFDTQAPLVGGTVSVRLLPTGATKPTTLGSARTTSAGAFTLAVAPLYSGELTAVYAGAPGRPAASADLGPVTVDPWTPSLTMNASSAAITHGTAVTYSGTATRTGTTGTFPAAGLVVHLVFTPSDGGKAVTIANLTVSSKGTFGLRYAPRTVGLNGTVSAVVSNTRGYVNASSSALPLAVS